MKDWTTCNLEDYIKLIDYRGRTPVKTESGVRLITAKNVKLGYLQLEPQEFIAEDNYESWMTRGIPNFGDVIFTTEAPLANVAQIDTHEKVAFAQRIIVMQPNPDKINQAFLKYMLLSEGVRNDILDNGTGATVVGIKSKLLRKIKISFPPLPEQQCIVSILDQCFEAIDKAKTNAEQNLQNAKELFESYLQGVFEKKGEGWIKMKLKEVISYDKNQNKHQGLPYVGLQDIESNSGVFLGNLEPYEVKSSTFYFNDKHVLYGRLRPYLNKVLLPDFEGHCSTEIFPIKVSGDITREFLFYWLITGTTVEKINATWTGARMPRANMNRVLDFDIYFPSIKEQEILVGKFETIRYESQKLETIYQKKISDLEELKKSILQKAFAGELKTEKMVEEFA